MIEWFKRRLAKKIWQSMLKYYEHYGEDFEGADIIAHFVISMDYMKKVADGKI